MGDGETVIDAQGRPPADRRATSLTMFRVWRQREVGELREAIAALNSELVQTRDRLERARLRNEIRSKTDCRDRLVAIPPAGPAPSPIFSTADQMLEDETLARFVYSLPVRHDAALPGGPAAPAVFTQVRDVLDEAVKNGEVRDDVSLDRAVDMLGRAFEAAMRDWADGHVSDPRTRLEELLRILFGGLAAERLSP
jgi:hypothetical protein